MRVREPIQVYLNDEERAELDRKASALGVSRSEVLRRGIAAVGGADGSGALRDLAARGLAVPASIQEGTPPRGRPVGSLDEILRHLDADRADR